jgi:hypothetical protein
MGARFKPTTEAALPVRIATASVLSLRAAYGLGLLVAPSKLAGGRWLGRGAREAAAQVPLRGLGAREVALHGLALFACLRGEPVRPLLVASIVGDLSDIGSTASSRGGLPDGSASATAAVAGVSLILSAALAVLNPR